MGNKTHQEILAKLIGRNRFNRLFAGRHQPDQPSVLLLEKYSKLALLQRVRGLWMGDDTYTADWVDEVKNER